MASICQKRITLPPFSSIANEALAASSLATRISRKPPPQPGQFKFILYQAEVPTSSSSLTATSTAMQGRNKKVATEMKTRTKSKISPNTSPKNSKVKKNSRKSPLSSSASSSSSSRKSACKMQQFFPAALQRTVIPNSHMQPPKISHNPIINNQNVANNTYINPHFKYSRSIIERNNSFYRPTTITEYVDPLRNYWQYTNYNPETMNANCVNQETTKTLLYSQSSALSEFQRLQNFAPKLEFPEKLFFSSSMAAPNRKDSVDNSSFIDL
ncbi:11691_t:CDS:2 [Ambispora gerdemannii]|uniref:11691_t:CDS:1 n=1 Tax=Ambispora gerdemannii TaxID=144530 RepID=A0A9N9BY93_9GLOM|nr:11691_t:CDS:2 [Ambispora gerdemannii]